MYSCIHVNQTAPFPFDNSVSSIVGRNEKIVNGIKYICDVTFNPEYDKQWSFDQKKDYFEGNSGFYKHWTYDINCTHMREMIMSWISDLPQNKRNKRNVLRHIMSYMSSENKDNGLLVAKWDGLYYEDGAKAPGYWINSSNIFNDRHKSKKPLKYAQCWVFAETLTSICRFLGIACRTVSGKNTLIDINLDNGIDFKEDIKKNEKSVEFVLLDKNHINNFLDDLIHERHSKSELWEGLKIYEAGDSYWNIHYWNEVFIDGHWQMLDSTPIIESEVNDDYKGMKIMGPSNISNFYDMQATSTDCDFDYLLSSINSPYRLWTTEAIVEDDRIIHIPYVYSLVYPHNEKISVYIHTNKTKLLFLNAPQVTTKTLTGIEDITSHYISSAKALGDFYFKNSYLEGTFYVQLVYLDVLGNFLKVHRCTCVFDDIDSQLEDVIDAYLLSYLLIEIDIPGKAHWLAFCRYV